jgi:hypothetical protein
MGGIIDVRHKNMVRMATYPDHYANHTLFMDHPPDIVRAHIGKHHDKAKH